MSAVEQPGLFALEPQLTDRQTFALEQIQNAQPGESVTAAEVGAALHERAGKHDRGERCERCVREGGSVLTSKALKPLVKKRRAGGWVLRVAPSSQGDRIPF